MATGIITSTRNWREADALPEAARAVNRYVPTWFGVPVSVPDAASRATPEGSAPAVTDHANVSRPPEARRVSAYARCTTPTRRTESDSITTAGEPRVTVTRNPVPEAASTDTATSPTGSLKVSPGTQMAPASLGSPLLSASTTCAARSARVGTTR
jgi:hypothetical protein